MRTCASIIPHLSMDMQISNNLNLHGNLDKYSKMLPKQPAFWWGCYSIQLVWHANYFSWTFVISKKTYLLQKRKDLHFVLQNLQKQACQSDKWKLFTCREISRILLSYLAIRELIAKSTASSFTVVVICKILHPMITEWIRGNVKAAMPSCMCLCCSFVQCKLRMRMHNGEIFLCGDRWRFV